MRRPIAWPLSAAGLRKCRARAASDQTFRDKMLPALAVHGTAASAGRAMLCGAGRRFQSPGEPNRRRFRSWSAGSTPCRYSGAREIGPEFVRIAPNDSRASKLPGAASAQPDRGRLKPIRPHDFDGIARRGPARRTAQPVWRGIADVRQCPPTSSDGTSRIQSNDARNSVVPGILAERAGPFTEHKLVTSGDSRRRPSGGPLCNEAGWDEHRCQCNQ